MPALIPTDHYGVITWLGRVQDRATALASVPVAEVALTFAGMAGEEHGGLTRPACSRVAVLYPQGRMIRNTRQLSILSREDLDAIARHMGIADLDPALVGASMVIEGIPDFTHVPPSSRLQADSGATLVVDMENRPCTVPGPGIEAEHPGFGRTFKPAAKGRRGVTAWVEREGFVRVGDKIRLYIPDQRPWTPSS